MPFPWRISAFFLLLLLPSSPAVAQESRADGRWSGALGAGLGIHLQCGECEAESLGVGASAGIQRELRPGLSVGASWTGAWFDSELGRLSRHLLHLDVVLLMRSSLSPFVRLGIGTALSTRVQVEGPPEPPGVGDMVISIGDTQGYGGLLGVGLDLPLSSPLRIIPELRFSAQRVEGATLAVAVALISVGIG
jgi:hypothetical protein